MLEAVRLADPEDATLYDHPVRYGTFPGVEADCAIPGYKVVTSPSHHWQLSGNASCSKLRANSKGL